jgi:hypothetical protein
VREHARVPVRQLAMRSERPDLHAMDPGTIAMDPRQVCGMANGLPLFARIAVLKMDKKALHLEY